MQCEERHGNGRALRSRTHQKATGYTAGLTALRAGDGIRTRDIQLGKLMLYQLSYSRDGGEISCSLVRLESLPTQGREGLNLYLTTP